MTAAAPALSSSTERPRKLTLSSRPLAFALLVVALLTAARLVGTVDSDVAWQLWIAQRLHAGATLYRDIIEVNPPLWFWMAVPLERISALLKIPIESVAIAAISVAAALSLTATNRLIDQIPADRRALWLSYAAIVLIAMPWMHSGQREQITLIATLPHVALVTARQQGRRVSPMLASLVGIGAALALALKHYFLIAPAFLELWLIVSLGRRWRPLRPETIAALLVGGLYAIAILTLAPDYLRSVVPFVRLFYGGLSAPNLQAMFGPFAIVLTIILATAAVQIARVRRACPLSTSLLIAAVGFGASYLIQFKGWPYHTLPALGFASLSLAAALAEMVRPPNLLRLGAPALLALPLVLAAQEQWTKPLPTPDLEQAVAGLKAGQSVAFIASEAAVPWAVTLQRGFRYPSRYISFWMVSEVQANAHERRPSRDVTAGWRQVVSHTVQDFRCAPPARIIVARPLPGDTSNFDILPMFTRDPAFAALLSHYRSVSRTTFEVFEPIRPLPPLPASQCRRGV